MLVSKRKYHRVNLHRPSLLTTAEPTAFSRCVHVKASIATAIRAGARAARKNACTPKASVALLKSQRCPRDLLTL